MPGSPGGSRSLASAEAGAPAATEVGRRASAEAGTPAATEAGTLALAAELLALAAELLAAISAIRRIARRAARRAWQDEPLPPAQSELLRLAAARPGLSVADAAHELRLAPNTISTLVGRLTAAGLLERARAASDGRSVRLSVTGKARQRIAGWRDLRAELGARALDQLPASDRETLAAALPALQRFAAQLEESP
jgi:DNA-binding MarR family transcriptional regulator